MLPWLQGRPQAEAGSVIGVEKEDAPEVMGLRAMAMRAIAQDLLTAIERRDLEQTAYVLECLAECIGDME